MIDQTTDLAIIQGHFSWPVACIEDGCADPQRNRQMCLPHFRDAKRAGRLGPKMNAAERVVARFWAKPVAVAGGCWNWVGNRDGRGYGLFNIRAFGSVRAHRFAYESIVGPIPDGLQIDHLCFNTSCVRPSHLEPVTNHENARRAAAVRGLLRGVAA